MARLKLGPFLLEKPLARGGMGEVWRAEHEGSGAKVAVKLLPRGSDHPDQRAAFEREVRAVAALDHPGIVRILDQGRVDAELEAASRRKLREGAPWMVMEYASGGSLARIGALPEWRTARAVLLSLLDALAHAHARGLIHRDLKPGNVLLCTGRDDRPGLKLTDFGIVHALAGDGPEATRAGTLYTMAPEQVLGDSRRIGPWTDLYALGCTAWILLTGEPLFPGRTGTELMRAQVREEPGPLRPAFPVPPAVSHWVRALLAKDPADRFKRAAEAAAALLSLDAGAAEERGSAAALAERIDELERLPELVVSEPTTLAVDGAPGLAGSRATWRPTSLPPGASMEPPSTWRHPVPRPAPSRLRGAGLGLLGLREHRLVGRDREMDRLWEAVQRVSASGRSEVVVIRGVSGIGRSRLAAVASERAHELGVAEVFRAEHQGGERAGRTLSRTVARALGVEGLDEALLREVCEDLFGPGRDAEVLAATVGSFAERPAREERAGVLGRAMRAMAGDRVVVAVLDDAQHDPCVLDWALDLLRRTDLVDQGILALVLLREDALEPVRGEVERLEAHARCTRLDLGPLDPGAMQELVRELLGLEATAAARILDRAGGNPGFAVSMVRALAEQKVLEPGPHGFSIRAGASLALPADLTEAWETRARQALAELPPEAWTWLVRAAVLGPLVRREVWTAACEGANPMVLRALEEELGFAGLLEEEETGWRFAQASLREALRSSAFRDRTLESHHLACAEALLAMPDADPDRLGRHLLHGGRPAEAIDPLVEVAVLPGNQFHGLERVALALEALEAGGEGRKDPRWGLLLARRAGLCLRSGHYGEAAESAAAAEDLAREEGWQEILVIAAFERATVALHTHQSDGALLAERAVALAEESGDPQRIGRARYLQAAAAWEARDWDRAEALHLEAVAHCRRHGDEPGAGDSLRDLGNLALLRGELDRAEAWYAEAGAIFQAHGVYLGLAHVRNGRADIARKRGELAVAEAGYREALALFDRIGSGQAMLARLNLGLVLLQREEWRRAREVIEATRSWLEDQQRPVWVGVAGVVLLPCYAALGDWEAWDRVGPAAEHTLAGVSFAQPDLVWAARRAEQLAARAGRSERAALAGRIAATQAERLGSP